MVVVSSGIKDSLAKRAPISQSNMNRLQSEDRAAHDWYRFVLSFPPHLVSDYLERFGAKSGDLVLDPFCGTGTTLVECKKQGIASVGMEANPMAHFASTVKTCWDASGDELARKAREIAAAVCDHLDAAGTPDTTPLPLFGRSGKARLPPDLWRLSPEREKLLLRGSISELPLHKTLVLLKEIERAASASESRYFRLALASALVLSIGNLHFGPEVGVGPPKADAGVVAPWLQRVETMARDINSIYVRRGVSATVLSGDARGLGGLGAALAGRRLSAVITSPPYPNEKDYTRTTRLESVILGFINNREQLQEFKRTLMRSNTRNVYKGDDDGRWVASNATVQSLVAAIEARRLELGKTSGFERMYAKVTELYFGGMVRHLATLRQYLQDGARLAYVVGDQASFFQVMIRTGTILAEIAERLGYEVVGLDLFRTRLATATRQQLREEVLVLRWPGETAR